MVRPERFFETMAQTRIDQFYKVTSSSSKKSKSVKDSVKSNIGRPAIDKIDKVSYNSFLV